MTDRRQFLTMLGVGAVAATLPVWGSKADPAAQIDCGFNHGFGVGDTIFFYSSHRGATAYTVTKIGPKHIDLSGGGRMRFFDD